MDINKPESHAMSKTTEKESADTPSNDDNALMTRLGLLLGDHRASTVKTQTHVHPVLSHHNHVNGIGYTSNERRKKPHLTTSPASTLSDKGIGSSVGSFDSEFRHNLSVVAELNTFQNRTGSLDSRTTEIVSHSRTDSGIPSHSRSSSDIIFTDNTTDVTAGRLAQQSSEKLWNADPRRNNGNTSSVTPPEVKPRRPSTSKARRNSAKSTDSLGEKGDSNNNSVMKLPQLCLDSPNNSTPTSSATSSGSMTPSVSAGDVTNHKLGRRRSSASNGNSAFDNEPLPPPPPPPPSNDNYYDDYEELPPPPPPPPTDDVSIHSRESSSDKTIDDIQTKRNVNRFKNDELQGNMMHTRNLAGKPPISRGSSMDMKRRENESLYGNGNAYHYHGDQPANQISYNYNHPYEDSSTQPSLLQRLRSSSEIRQIPRQITSSASDDALRGRDTRRDWSHDQRRDVINPSMQMPHLTSSVSSLGIGRAESTQRVIQHERSSSNASRTSSINVMWDDARSHSLSVTAPPNPLITQNIHRPSASIDNSYFNRRSSNRSSTRSNPGSERRKAMSNASSTSDMRVRFAPFRQPEVNLHSLLFELPSAVTSETKFTGREWVFSEIMTALNSPNSKTNKGVVIIGGEGTGKTALIHHLEAYSYHGKKKMPNHSTLTRREHESSHRAGSFNMSRSGSPVLQARQYYHPGSNNSSRTASPAPSSVFSGKPGSKSGSQTSLSGEEAHKRLSSQVVAYHYCQADNNTTCYVPEFLQSIAAQLAHAPQLTAYREMLLQEPHLQNLLSLRSCIQNPVQALHKAIMEPLVTLRQLNKLPRLNLVILLDGLSEAEQHRPDYGHSILTFLQRYLPDFPDFIKVIATCRTSGKDFLQDLPMYTISLDIEDNETNVIRDAQVYVNHRISTSNALANFILTGKPDVASNQRLLAQHLVDKCHGSILYLRLILDLLSNGKLMPKSSGFKIIPVNMNEVFSFMCNLRFSSATSFSRVRDILAIALASLYPLRDEELFQAVSAGYTTKQLHEEEFKQLMDSLSQFLIPRMDGSRSFIHPSFREWLGAGSFNDNNMATLTTTKKFSIDARRGHALLATLLSRQPVTRLNEHAALELAHHLLKARMFRGQSKTTGINSSDLHAIWMAQCSLHLSGSLTTVRNLFFPNIKVSKLLLRAGANPNMRSQVLCEAPAICVAAHSGYAEFVELLLTHGATIDFPANNGMTALAYAAAAGHRHVVEMLIKFKPRLDLVDRNGHSPLLHAISRDHSDIATLLLTCDLYVSPEQRRFSAQQALVAAATIGNIQLIRYLLDHTDPALHCDVNSVDPTRGESSLSAAASRGKSTICEFLIRERRAKIEQRNKLGMTPLLCAVKQGEWDTADLLLTLGSSIEGPDHAGRTPLITAASNGHLGVLELLLSRGANVEACDKESLTALGWAALKGHIHCARSLIEHRSNIHHLDRNGRAPLDLAAFYGDAQVVDLLLEAGSDITRVDNNNTSPLDCAIGCQHVAVVSLMLKRGAMITPTSWELAAGKPDVTTALINKCVEDGNMLYKDENFAAAREVYATALSHVGEPVTPQMPEREGGNNAAPVLHGHLRDLTTVLLLGLARCARKLNDLNTAEMASTRALELKPGWYEALYVRARVRRESGRLAASLRDVEEAEVNAPQHNKKEIVRLIERIHEELKRSGKRNSLSEATENSLRIPGSRRNSNSGPAYRPRVNSTSSFHGNNNNNSRSSSPSPSVVSEFPISHSFQPQSYLRNYSPKPMRHNQQYQQDFRQPQQQASLQDSRNGFMAHSSSQENMNDPRASLPMYQGIEQSRMPYQHRLMPHNQQNVYPNYPPSQEFVRTRDIGNPRDNVVYHNNNNSYPHVNRQSFNPVPPTMQPPAMAANNADGRSRVHNNVPNVQQPYRRTVATEL